MMKDSLVFIGVIGGSDVSPKIAVLAGEVGHTLHNRQACTTFPARGKDLRKKVAARHGLDAGDSGKAALTQGLSSKYERRR